MTMVEDARPDGPPPAEPTAEQVLHVLTECAADMTNARDRTVALEGIARRTRRLLGTDMCYLSLNDLTAGETYIHVTDGVRSDEYRAIRMPLGTGVLGAVAAGGRAAQTPDYLADPDMNHIPEIDELVAAEGVRGILGAPLRIGGIMVGALLVADRRPTVYSDAVVRALEQIAAQASVALEQWRLTQEIAALHETLATAEATADDRVRQLEAVARLDEQLVDVLLARPDVAGILAVLRSATGTAVALHDPAGTLRAGEQVTERGTLSSWEMRAAVQAAVQSGEPVETRVDGASLVVMAACAGDDHLATIIARGPLTAAAAAMLQRAAVFLTVTELFGRTVADADSREQWVLFDDLIARRLDDARLPARAREAGLSVTAGNAVIAVAADTAQRYQALAVARDALRPADGIVALHGDGVCIVVGTDSPEAVGAIGRRVVDALAGADLRALAGAAFGEDGLDGIADAHARAHRVLAAQQSLGWTAGYADAVQLGTAGIVISAADRGFVEELRERFVGALERYDAAHGTDLCLTAWTWFECGGHLDTISARLFIHRNTVRQRLERVGAILGDDWRSPQRGADVHFALRLWRLGEQRAEESGCSRTLT